MYKNTLVALLISTTSFAAELPRVAESSMPTQGQNLQSEQIEQLLPGSLIFLKRDDSKTNIVYGGQNLATVRGIVDEQSFVVSATGALYCVIESDKYKKKLYQIKDGQAQPLTGNMHDIQSLTALTDGTVFFIEWARPGFLSLYSITGNILKEHLSECGGRIFFIGNALDGAAYFKVRDYDEDWRRFYEVIYQLKGGVLSEYTEQAKSVYDICMTPDGVLYFIQQDFEGCSVLCIRHDDDYGLLHDVNDSEKKLIMLPNGALYYIVTDPLGSCCLYRVHGDNPVLLTDKLSDISILPINRRDTLYFEACFGSTKGVYRVTCSGISHVIKDIMSIDPHRFRTSYFVAPEGSDAKLFSLESSGLPKPLMSGVLDSRAHVTTRTGLSYLSLETNSPTKLYSLIDDEMSPVKTDMSLISDLIAPVHGDDVYVVGRNGNQHTIATIREGVVTPLVNSTNSFSNFQVSLDERVYFQSYENGERRVQYLTSGEPTVVSTDYYNMATVRGSGITFSEDYISRSTIFIQDSVNVSELRKLCFLVKKYAEKYAPIKDGMALYNLFSSNANQIISNPETLDLYLQLCADLGNNDNPFYMYVKIALFDCLRMEFPDKYGIYLNIKDFKPLVPEQDHAQRLYRTKQAFQFFSQLKQEAPDVLLATINMQTYGQILQALSELEPRKLEWKVLLLTVDSSMESELLDELDQESSSSREWANMQYTICPTLYLDLLKKLSERNPSKWKNLYDGVIFNKL